MSPVHLNPVHVNSARVARAWWLVGIAVVMEITWAVALPLTEGFSRLLPSAVVIAAMILAFFPLSVAARHLPIGTLYAVWTGLGAAGTATLSILVHGDAITPVRIIGLSCIVIGVVGLRLFDGRRNAPRGAEGVDS